MQKISLLCSHCTPMHDCSWRNKWTKFVIKQLTQPAKAPVKFVSFFDDVHLHLTLLLLAKKV